MADLKIGVTGLKELRKELKRAGDEFPGELRATNKGAAEIVAAAGRANAQRQPRVRAANPRPSRQHWADYVNTIRALASQTRAQVGLGSARVPWAMGSNFGSLTKRQFPAVAHPDHALYKAIEAKRPEVVEEYGKMLEKLTARAFPD